ncbi:RagB/SusD family nutrient uptake outer membrane protein [Roseisolibacter sp. H3M3-2]|uniref:RagB/SusD family nutrient uptake outer membrane protein n=1 Tax=Roseisolibacter sp. H3M3-2 TaxID=3031323 RepID=UPI0023DC439B|nr:RagB/SusD family nutrient uptake outer membrane protein [Roseisolibacter sp. H3M3-2]MDF1502720.1 RagB/SusD family nutrient uptake outer membrane protein [Roseisolibacter sp. H3M3-2]
MRATHMIPTNLTGSVRRAAAVLAAGALAAGCTDKQLVTANPINVTPEGAASNPLGALQLQATGIVASERDNTLGYIRDVALFGREAYFFQLQDGRWVTGYFRDYNDNTSFGAGGTWGVRYTNLRNIKNFYASITAAGSALSTQQAAAARGFGQTMEALQLLYLINTRNDLGIAVEVPDDPQAVAPVVSRDSAFRYITNTLDAGLASLNAGGSTFPFALPTTGGGFTGFTTPTTFRQVNRALKARVEAYRASIGCGQTCYQAALTALGQSFITADLTAGNLDLGVYNIFSTAAGDATNGLWANRNDMYVNMTLFTDASVPQTDTRVTTASVAAPSRSQTNSDVSTRIFNIYPENTTPIPIIDNEELWLLRAEALWYTGDRTGATAILNRVAQVAGGATGNRYTQAANDAGFVDQLLAERRLSLLLEGHRWIDVRRFGRLNTLPAGGQGFTVASRQVIPQAECVYRDRTGDPALKGPGCP